MLFISIPATNIHIIILLYVHEYNMFHAKKLNGVHTMQTNGYNLDCEFWT